MAFWNRVTGLIAGGAVARAAADGATPVLEPVRQHAWSRNKLRVLDPETAARLVTQAIIGEPEAENEAGRSGYGPNRLKALIHLTQVAPGLADARALKRRAKIGTDDLHHVYAKAQIEPQYWDDLDNLLNVLLSPAEVAAAVQQGHLPNRSAVEGDDPILPPVSPEVPAVGGQVTADPPDGGPPSHVPLTQIDLDPYEQARGSGTSFEQLKVLANLAGLPPGPELLLNMWNRELLDEDSVDAGIREGHMKTKWAQAFKRLRWNVLSPQEYASAHLRKWVTQEEMYKGGKLTGHTKEQMDLLFLNRGRPASPTQMWRAWARGVIGPRGVPTEFEDHAKAIAISDIRPEYAEMLWNIRFNFPSQFQLNRLVEAGAITPDKAAEWAHKSLYDPDVVTALHAYWKTVYPGPLGSATAKADPHVTKAENQLWTTLHRSYVAAETDDATATATLPLAGAAADSVAGVLRRWQAERELIRKQLTPAQVKKAYAKAAVNAATNEPWTRDEALAALIERGYASEQALSYLNI